MNKPIAKQIKEIDERLKNLKASRRMLDNNIKHLEVKRQRLREE